MVCTAASTTLASSPRLSRWRRSGWISLSDRASSSSRAGKNRSSCEARRQDQPLGQLMRTDTRGGRGRERPARRRELSPAMRASSAPLASGSLEKPYHSERIANFRRRRGEARDRRVVVQAGAIRARPRCEAPPAAAGGRSSLQRRPISDHRKVLNRVVCRSPFRIRSCRSRRAARRSGLDQPQIDLRRLFAHQSLQPDRIAQPGEAALAEHDDVARRGEHDPLHQGGARAADRPRSGANLRRSS